MKNFKVGSVVIAFCCFSFSAFAMQNRDGNSFYEYGNQIFEGGNNAETEEITEHARPRRINLGITGRDLRIETHDRDERPGDDIYGGEYDM